MQGWRASLHIFAKFSPWWCCCTVVVSGFRGFLISWIVPNMYAVPIQCTRRVTTLLLMIQRIGGPTQVDGSRCAKKDWKGRLGWVG